MIEEWNFNRVRDPKNDGSDNFNLSWKVIRVARVEKWGGRWDKRNWR